MRFWREAESNLGIKLRVKRACWGAYMGSLATLGLGKHTAIISELPLLTSKSKPGRKWPLSFNAHLPLISILSSMAQISATLSLSPSLSFCLSPFCLLTRWLVPWDNWTRLEASAGEGHSIICPRWMSWDAALKAGRLPDPLLFKVLLSLLSATISVRG